jgi:LAO/AO transport system kinase
VGVSDVVERVLSGDVRAVARVCRAVDDRIDGYLDVLKALHRHTGNAWVIGVTGNPGAGKSTLTDRLVVVLRRRHARVGVIAVDPTSPFSGGAILGDRIRMQRHFDDPGVFIRSVATRGTLGGLSASATDLVRVLDAWGAGAIVVETVGVGQDELDVARTAHTTLVVMAPGLGDDVQAIKAGILECADVFAVNKADRPGADATVRDLQNMLALGALSLSASPPSTARHTAAASHPAGATSGERAWMPPIVKTVSTKNEGMDELVQHLDEHRAWLSTEAGSAVRVARERWALVSYLRETLTRTVVEGLGSSVEAAARRVASREVDLYTACETLIDDFRAGSLEVR